LSHFNADPSSTGSAGPPCDIHTDEIYFQPRIPHSGLFLLTGFPILGGGGKIRVSPPLPRCRRRAWTSRRDCGRDGATAPSLTRRPRKHSPLTGLHASPRHVLSAAARLASRNAAASSGSIWPRLSATRAPPDLRDEKSTVAYATNSTRASTFRRLRLRLAPLCKKGEGPNGDVVGAPDV